MNNTGYAHFAEALVFVHGPKAIHEACRHAELARKSGDEDMAAHWQATLAQLKQAQPQLRAA